MVVVIAVVLLLFLNRWHGRAVGMYSSFFIAKCRVRNSSVDKSNTEGCMQGPRGS